jgi:hypothetical protein
MARPSILTEALCAEFCSKVRMSGSVETAIKATGIGRESYFCFARKVRDGGGTPLQKSFIRAVQQAESEIKLLRESLLQKHATKTWQAAAWLLERQHSNEYGQRRPPPLPDPDPAIEEPQVNRIFWRKSERPTPAAAPAEAPAAVPDEPPVFGDPGD